MMLAHPGPSAVNAAHGEECTGVFSSSSAMRRRVSVAGAEDNTTAGDTGDRNRFSILLLDEPEPVTDDKRRKRRRSKRKSKSRSESESNDGSDDGDDSDGGRRGGSENGRYPREAEQVAGFGRSPSNPGILLAVAKKGDASAENTVTPTASQSLWTLYASTTLALLKRKIPLFSPRLFKFILACLILDGLVPDDYTFESENFGCFEGVEGDGLFCTPLEMLDNMDDLLIEMSELVDTTLDSLLAQMDEVDWVHSVTCFRDHFLPTTHPTTMQGLRGWMSFLVAYSRAVLGSL